MTAADLQTGGNGEGESGEEEDRSNSKLHPVCGRGEGLSRATESGFRGEYERCIWWFENAVTYGESFRQCGMKGVKMVREQR